MIWLTIILLFKMYSEKIGHLYRLKTSENLWFPDVFGAYIRFYTKALGKRSRMLKQTTKK